MINLTIGWQKVEVDFMGETVTAEVRPLTSEHMLLLTPHMDFDRPPKSPEKMSAKEKAAAEKEASKRMFELQRAAAPFFPEIVRNIKGLKVNNADLDPAILGDESALTVLAAQIITKAFVATQIDKESKKN